METTIKTFNDVRKYLDDLPCINYGGCGISAFAMYKWLLKEKLIDKTFKFVLLYRSYNQNDYLNNKNTLRNKKGKVRAASHVCIYYDGEYLDSNEIINIQMAAFVQFVTEEWFIISCLNNKRDWNSDFDRKYIKNIELKLNISLKEIEL